MKVFIPFSETLIEQMGLSIGDLVPFQLEYQCLRMQESDSDVDAMEPSAEAAPEATPG